MADDADSAQQRTEQLINTGIARVRQRLISDGAELCQDCGEEIPPMRRQSLPGVVTCVECQSAREHNSRHWRHRDV